MERKKRGDEGEREKRRERKGSERDEESMREREIRRVVSG